jgi:hypothetical protein
MQSNNRILTRRDFIRTGSCAAIGGFLTLPFLHQANARMIKKSRVVMIRHPLLAESRGDSRYRLLEKMIDEAITVLFEAEHPTSAWQQIANPKDVVGIKTNVWHLLPTPTALEKIVKKRLIDVGVDEKNIAVDDRGVRKNPVFNKSTALINMRPLRTHHWSGLGSLLKNYIMFVKFPFTYHSNACERLGAIWNLDHIKGKTRLNILVMITPLFHGIGPHHFSRRYIWPYGGLIISTDPVAADSIGAHIIHAKRTIYFGEEKPISPPPHHILAADKHFGLGNSHPSHIELIKLGWMKNQLI